MMTNVLKQRWKTEKNKDTFKTRNQKLETRKMELQKGDLKHRTKKFTVDSILFIRTLPAINESKIISNQLLRSASSVGANTRSAFRGRSKKEFIAKIGLVIEEVDESLFWL